MSVNNNKGLQVCYANFKISQQYKYTFFAWGISGARINIL